MRDQQNKMYKCMISVEDGRYLDGLIVQINHILKPIYPNPVPNLTHQKVCFHSSHSHFL